MDTRTLRLSDLVAGLLAESPASQRLDLRLADCVIEVRCNSAELRAALASYFHAYLDPAPGTADLVVTLLEGPQHPAPTGLVAYPPGPGKTRIKDEYADFPDGRLLRKRLTGMMFIFGPVGHLTVGPCLANLNQAVNFINNRFIQWSLERGYLLCHAAGVAGPHAGLALAGMPGAGKSTLALHFLDAGLDFVSNDRLLIRRSGVRVEMRGVAKAPRINPGTILNSPRLQDLIAPAERARLAALPAEELWALESKYDADVEANYGPGRSRMQAPLAGAMILNWRREAGPARFPSVDLARRPELLAALMKAPGVHFHLPAGQAQPDLSPPVYIDALRGLTVLEACGGVDFAAAVAAGRALLG